ncbi:hypothetical protein B0J13DRAFT_520559 [Dactylonectria estremocensis]|uniref:Uncharacterized protein n=1 Tax=Dactylonectria estremocensis TaxID=1079267 RepID=A0A9P9FC54_9HYPO|nr:hypothetical protein B0J13DRAFT_520559 [Dactylonectria estremocensis]
MASDYFNPAAHPDYMNTRSVVILHPAYDSPHNLLIQLPQVDTIDSEGHPGIHHQTVLLACQIIANNCFTSGFLYYDQQGTMPVMREVPLDGILTGTRYYFILDRDPKYKYPIVACFSQWRFPHCGIPACWPTLRFRLNSDRRCALTNQVNGVRSAEVVPRGEEKWFNDNRMSMYGGGTSAASQRMANCRNQVYLDQIIGRCFRTNLFAIVPKPSTVGRPHEGKSGTQYCVHVFSRDAPRFYRTYHNVPVRNLDWTTREHLFARFAWTVFTLLDTFILANVPRNIAVYRRHDSGTYHCATVPMSGRDLHDIYAGSFGTPFDPSIWMQMPVNQPNNTIPSNHAVQPYIAIQPHHTVQPNHVVQPSDVVQPSRAAQPNNASWQNHEVRTNNAIRSATNTVQSNNDDARSSNTVRSANTVQTNNAILLEPVVRLNNAARSNSTILPSPFNQSHNTGPSSTTAILNNRTPSTPVAGSNYTVIPPRNIIPTSTVPPNNVVLPALSHMLNVRSRTPRSAPSDEEEMERYRKRIRTGN